MQPANCQWLLTVDLHQFINIKNAEIRRAQFCCCDMSDCSEELKNLHSCSDSCDTSFIISVSHCLIPSSCLLFTPTQFNSESVLNLLHKYEFVLANASNLVSINIHVYIHTHTVVYIKTYYISQHAHKRTRSIL